MWNQPAGVQSPVASKATFPIVGVGCRAGSEVLPPVFAASSRAGFRLCSPSSPLLSLTFITNFYHQLLSPTLINHLITFITWKLFSLYNFSQPVCFETFQPSTSEVEFNKGQLNGPWAVGAVNIGKQRNSPNGTFFSQIIIPQLINTAASAVCILLTFQT